MKRDKTEDAVELMDRWFGGDEEWNEMVAEEELKARIAQAAYALRTQAGLTQTRLGKMISTSQAVISKLENADYHGSSLEMLWRICRALHRRIEVTCTDGEPRASCRVAVTPA